MKKMKKEGFTLIELLVVIAIIGLLSTLAVVSLNNAREKSRDARRVSDIKQIQTALELYMNDCNSYPATAAAGGSIAGGDANCSAGTETYMQVIPTPPTPPTGITAYTYAIGATDPTTYTLGYCLEGDVNGVTGCQTATPGGLQ